MTGAVPEIAPRRILVVGSGLAGLTVALLAHQRHEVVLVTKGAPEEGSTLAAQGGMAAALGEGDSSEAHAADTLAAAAGLAQEDAVELLCRLAPERIRALQAAGVVFDLAEDGRSLALGQEAAHSARRIVHAGGDATGAVIERALLAEAARRGIVLRRDTMLAELIIEDGRVQGATVIGADGFPERLDADAVVIATGGAGQLYRHSTNPLVSTGDGVAAALRAGAALADLEFYQFHPTALVTEGAPLLISEAVRGEGAVLLDQQGRRFLLGAVPGAELAPRDVVARAMAEAMAQQGGEPILLDATALGADYLAERFPSIDAGTRARGLDWSRQPIPVSPAAHYWMGGIATDLHGRSSLPGLYAVGEAACTGVHGANRLASNSLVEASVFAARCAEALGETWPAAEAVEDPSTPPSSAELGDEGDPVEGRDDGMLPPQPFTRAALQQLMWQHVGLERHATGLDEALRILNSWRVPAEDRLTRAGQEDANLLELARAIARAALARTESRGAHHRRDHPETAPGPARRTIWTREVDEHARSISH